MYILTILTGTDGKHVPGTIGKTVVNSKIIDVTNLEFHMDEGEAFTVVYIHPSRNNSIQGFYLWGYIANIHRYALIQCRDPPRGYIEIQFTVMYNIMIYGRNTEEVEPKSIYEDYCKDMLTRQYYGCSYIHYLQVLIDRMVDDVNSSIKVEDEAELNSCIQNDVTMSDVNDDLTKSNTDTNILQASISNSQSKAVRPSWGETCDFNDKDRTMGFLPQASTNFAFIIPDRPPIQLDTVDKYIDIANVILDTGVSNNKQARIPIQSGLKVEAWEKYLQEYPNDKLIQYIKFGYPLSLSNPASLHNVVVSNHASAIQFSTAVSQYITKESELRAILGPADKIDHPQYHCSPILTRPKDNDKRRVILNLSHPKDASVNDNVTRDKFDGTPFALKFQTIDNIVSEIRQCEDPVIFKVDITRAFRNLWVDPADGLKLGISWEGKFYIDGSAAFGWVHGSASFKLLSDAVAYIMKQKGYRLFWYIDDYIVVLPKSKAGKAFNDLCELLLELGLPTSIEKQTAPCTRLTCLGIDVNIDTNTISMGQEKIEAIYGECLQANSKTKLSKSKFQSLTGKLLYIHKCVRPASIFINRIWLYSEIMRIRLIFTSPMISLEIFNGSLNFYLDSMGWYSSPRTTWNIMKLSVLMLH